MAGRAPVRAPAKKTETRIRVPLKKQPTSLPKKAANQAVQTLRVNISKTEPAYMNGTF
jgi:hypothetical protein